MKKREKKQDDKRSTGNNNNINNRKYRNMSDNNNVYGGASQLLGMFGGHQAERRNYRNNRNLMGLQNQYQRGLNQQGHDLQMDMWNKTNYGAQVGHMKDAGLNPALMYKGAGAGGTTGSQGGGSASMGSSQQGKVMDMQNLLMGAQIKSLEAKANSDNASAEAKRGYEAKESGGRLEKLIAEKLNINEQKAKTIQETLNLKTVDEWNNVKQELDQLKVDKKMTGSQIIDLMTTVGLDPTNNPEDMEKMQLILGLIVGSRVAKDLISIIKPKFKK